MKKAFRLSSVVCVLLSFVLQQPALSQAQLKTAQPSTQANQSATIEPEALTRDEVYVENVSEAQSIEKTNKSVLKIRNFIRSQSTFEALMSNNSYKSIYWEGFYEFRNPGDKTIVITDFRVNGIPPRAFEGKPLSVMTRSSPNSVTVFGNLDRINTGKDPRPTKLPIDVPPHTTRYLKIHLILDVSSGDETLKFQDESEAYKWFSAAIGLQQSADGHFWCAFTGFPIEVSTADHETLKYEPLTVLLVPGCQMHFPSLRK